MNDNTFRDITQCLAAVAFTGADAAAFLHGQLTVDVMKMPPFAARRAAYCSRQGRVLAGGLLCCLPPAGAEARFVFVVAADVAADIAQALKRFVLRAKVRVEVLPARFAAAGGDGDAAGEMRAAEDGDIVTINGGDWRLRWTTGAAEDFAAADETAVNDWMRGEIKRGIAWPGAAASGEFLPQFLNLEALGGVDFDKGCYVGQEIIARLYYRGAVKSRAMILAADAGAPPPPMTPVLADDGRAAGAVINSAADGGGYVALAAVKLDAREAALRINGGAVSLSPPPYALPDERR